MRMRHPLIAFILLPAAALADGALVIQPQASGGLRLLSEGGAGGANALSVMQPAGKTLTLQLLPVAAGQCDGGNLTIASLRLSLLQADNQQRLNCGETLRLRAEAQSRQVGVQIKSASLQPDLSGLMPSDYGLRPQIGSVRFNVEGEEIALWPLFLDLSVLQQEMPVLTAAFDRPALQFGLVGEQHDAAAAVRLRISKTRLAGGEILPYRLSFESAQLQDGRYRLRSSRGERFIPYAISVGGQEIAPGGAWHGRIPAGIATSDIVNINFTLPGSAIRGMEAGSRLLDTLTAVITPEI